MFFLITKPNKACRLEIAGTDDKLGKKKRRQKNDKKWYFVTIIVLTYCEKKLF